MSVVSLFLANLGATLLNDEEKVLQPVLDNYTTSLINDPSITNASVQSLAFQAAIASIAPQAGSTGIKDTATAVKNLIDIQLPALVAKASAELQAAAATPVSAPAPAPASATPVTPTTPAT